MSDLMSWIVILAVIVIAAILIGWYLGILPFGRREATADRASAASRVTPAPVAPAPAPVAPVVVEPSAPAPVAAVPVEPAPTPVAGPYGAGSAAALPAGSAPAGFSIKGNADSGLYHTTDSPWYGRTKAEAWFATEADAEKAGFKRWDRKS